MRRLIFIAVLIISSCEEVVIIDLPSPQNLVVVEGWVTDVFEQQYVRLTISNGFSEQVSVLPITDASVVIQSRIGDTFLYSHNENGYYESNQEFAGSSSTEYRVRVLLSDGEEIRSAWEKMPEAVPISNITVDSFLENDPDNPNRQITVFFPKIQATDPVGNQNFYRWVFFKNGVVFKEPESITLQDDRFFDGNLIPNSFQSFSYNQGDEIIVQFQSINKEAYDFLALLKTQITTLGTSGGTTPAIVNGNIGFVSEEQTATVLGYFGTVAISSDTIVVQ